MLLCHDVLTIWPSSVPITNLQKALNNYHPPFFDVLCMFHRSATCAAKALSYSLVCSSHRRAEDIITRALLFCSSHSLVFFSVFLSQPRAQAPSPAMHRITSPTRIGLMSQPYAQMHFLVMSSLSKTAEIHFTSFTV